ncbi:hypothetical protein [Pantoea sp. AV62]|uniref:hypothetical protein n=1 Tax=Pantoea sp. AV62 TaxID=1990688 RepID=UPI0011815453|nr:hypothetical protein [Pantoea sp. AV62]
MKWNFHEKNLFIALASASASARHGGRRVALLCFPDDGSAAADNLREEGQAIETWQQLRQQMRENNPKRCLDECLKYGYAAKT